MVIFFGNFDFLRYMIETAHMQGFEFHAWLNPYRASMDNQSAASFAENHVMRAHPEWCIKYAKRHIMNPGIPEVRAHIVSVVEELTRNYDLDGIHFDDYFYPYKVAGETFNDLATFQQYGAGFNNIEDWRRNNIDLLIYNLSKTIKAVKPRVQFGISPFGVWRNQDRDPKGSATRAGLTCYDDLYADILLWLREGWIDYVMPQVYWTIGFTVADHETIVKWWSENNYGKPIYVGHGAYRIGEANSKDPRWGDPSEMGKQIRLGRNIKGVKGSVYFSSKSLISNRLGIADTLRNNYYQFHALTPEVIKDSSLLACDPPELRQVYAENGRATIRWKPSRETEKRLPYQYLVYRFKMGKVDFRDGRNIVGIIPSDQKDLVFHDNGAIPDETYLYAVTVVDCQHRETPPDDLVVNKEAYGQTIGSNQTMPESLPKAPKKKKKRSFWDKLFGRNR
jgi:uncharacterized lipoprotein YddW (UPF0748 family)